MILPSTPNTCTHSDKPSRDALLWRGLALPSFFSRRTAELRRANFPRLGYDPPGVYPVLREDWAFRLGGGGSTMCSLQVAT